MIAFYFKRRKGTRKQPKYRGYPVEYGSNRPYWELPTSYLKHEKTRRYSIVNAWRTVGISRPRPRKILKHDGHLVKVITRELLRRKDVAYRGFINKIIHDAGNIETHYLVFADWLEEHGRYLESRRVKQYVAK